MGVFLVRRLEVSLYLYTENGMDVLVTGCAVLPQTMVVVHRRSLRPFRVSPGGGAGGSQALWEPPNGAAAGRKS